MGKVFRSLKVKKRIYERVGNPRKRDFDDMKRSLSQYYSARDQLPEKRLLLLMSGKSGYKEQTNAELNAKDLLLDLYLHHLSEISAISNHGFQQELATSYCKSILHIMLLNRALSMSAKVMD